MGLHFASVLFLLSGLCPVFLSEQDVPAASGQVEHAPLPPSGHPPSVFPERPVSWQKLLPNLARDQKDIWLFPISRAVEHHGVCGSGLRWWKRWRVSISRTMSQSSTPGSGFVRRISAVHSR